MKLLIIEDDSDVLQFLTKQLKTAGYIVDGTESGQEGMNMAFLNAYDLIISDLHLPKISGAEICKTLRSKQTQTPILLLTVESEISSKVDLLNLGADDYMTKPFSFDELIARIQAILRRPKIIEQELLILRDLTLDKYKQKVTYQDKEITLTRKEFLILEFLMRNKGNVVTRVTLLDNIWDKEVDLFSNAIETHILNLRKKLDANNPTAYIKTISGRGYAIE